MNYRECLYCAKDTEQDQTYYNPDIPAYGKLWRCTECGTELEFVDDTGEVLNTNSIKE